MSDTSTTSTPTPGASPSGTSTDAGRTRPERTRPTSPGRLRRAPNELTSAQKLMVFVFSMTLFGLANIVTEVLPEITIGPVEISVSYLVFVPVVMVSLFHPLYAALGAPLGEIVFVDLLMGDFSGIGEIEGYVQLFLGLYVAGCLVRDPRNRRQLAVAAIVAVLIDKFLSATVDIAKVLVGIDPDSLGEADGLVQGFIALEAIDLLVALVVTGILFGALPAMWLAPRLYGKIEPLMGMEPRDPANPPTLGGRRAAPFILLAVALTLLAALFAFVEQLDEFNGREDGVSTWGAFEPEFLEEYGTGFLWVSVAAVVAVLVVAVLVTRAVVRRRGADR
ncbi:cell division protein FtsQ [Oerskovia flava]|uniref:cell division protein FtsQ n=1 Tax=Oerskovia flava TaxID=2986422 RepID=UPI00223EC656|nr:cell division protein FtsQ [Oerskovia sp. JB1-3-2]